MLHWLYQSLSDIYNSAYVAYIHKYIFVYNSLLLFVPKYNLRVSHRHNAHLPLNTEVYISLKQEYALS